MGYGENSLYGMNSGDVKYESFDLPEEYKDNLIKRAEAYAC